MSFKIKLNKNEFKSDKKAKVAIIVPYRNQILERRKKQLKIFLKYMQEFLRPYKDWKIFVIKQSFDNNKFNRGKLLNIGFKIAEKEKFNTFILHDVDLLPESGLLPLYTTYPEKPIHIGSLWKDKYDYPNFVGGIISINKNDYKKINGFPNFFWGWGGEDDALSHRMKVNNLNIWEPLIEDWGKIMEMKHSFDPSEGNTKKKENRIIDKNLWKKNGINNLIYKVYKKKKYNKIIKIYVNLNNFEISDYLPSYNNIANKLQEIENFIKRPRKKITKLKKTNAIFKKTLNFLIDEYFQGTYIYIKNNNIEIFASFNFDKNNYLNKPLIIKYYNQIANLIKDKKIDSLEFFINTQPFSILYENKSEYLPIVSDIIEKNSNDIKLEQLI